MTGKNTETKTEITFNEYRAWLTGLIRGKRGCVPDLEDWKQIKHMMDKVVPEVEVITLPAPIAPHENQRANPPPFGQVASPWYSTPQWNDCTGYVIFGNQTPYISNGGTCTNIPCDNANMSVSFSDIKLEDLDTKVNTFTSSAFTMDPNPAMELSIAIDDLIKTQEEVKV